MDGQRLTLLMHQTKKRESSLTTTCDDIEFGMKNVMQNSLVSFFCADKSLIQHTHREIVHKEYEK